VFKIIRDFVPQPQFMMLCDRSCATYAYATVPTGLPGNEESHQAIWARSLLEQGWKITLAEHVCPAHVQKDKEGESLIVIPTAAIN
jgi:hypothetical protein